MKEWNVHLRHCLEETPGSHCDISALQCLMDTVFLWRCCWQSPLLPKIPQCLKCCPYHRAGILFIDSWHNFHWFGSINLQLVLGFSYKYTRGDNQGRSVMGQAWPSSACCSSSRRRQKPHCSLHPCPCNDPPASKPSLLHGNQPPSPLLHWRLEICICSAQHSTNPAAPFRGSPKAPWSSFSLLSHKEASRKHIFQIFPAKGCNLIRDWWWLLLSQDSWK